MATMKFRKTYLSIMVLACTIFLLQSAVFNIPTTSACGTVAATLDVEADVGSIHFSGEMAEFYILVSYLGKPIDAEISAMLYYNGTLLANQSASVEHVATGLYMVQYSIPMEALAGTYVLVVNASRCTLKGTTLKSFLLSQTFTNWNAWIIDIQGNIATINTNIGLIQIDISAINATLHSINGTLVTIQTDIGIIKASLEDIKLNITSIQGNIVNINTTLGDIQGTLVSIQGNIATIKTDLGNITLSLPPTQTTTLGIPIAAIFAGIAAFASTISAAVLLRRRKAGNH
jgi:hypothetical protein